jgi:hypothetical protein
VTTAYLAAVLDTLLPGDAGSPAPLPSGSRAGIDFNDLSSTQAEALRTIAEEAGSEAEFATVPAAKRAEVMRRVEAKAPTAFQALLAAALMRYYQSEAVTTAMGWRTAPPQPGGHKLPMTDEATWARLEKVRTRGRIWR